MGKINRINGYISDKPSSEAYRIILVATVNW
jgi:hypothetical protein